MIDLCCGVSTHVAAEKHDVPQSTVAEWALEIKSGQNRSTTEIRKEDFNARLVALLFKGFDVVEAWAKWRQTLHLFKVIWRRRMSWAKLFSNDVIESLAWFNPPTSQSNEGNYLSWLHQFHGHVLSAPMGERHLRLWGGSSNSQRYKARSPRGRLAPGRPQSLVRQSLRSLTLVRRELKYCLYVSETQDQTDKHVASVCHGIRAGRG